MADGRLYTDYRPRCDIQLEHQAPMSGTWEYRQFLIHNADALVAAHRSQAYERAYCGPCKEPYNQGTMAPEADKFVCDKVSCSRVPGAPGGIGTGRDHGILPEQKAAQDAFLAMQVELQKKHKGSCCGPDPGYYPLPGVNLAATQHGDVRWAVPGGGRPLSGGDPSRPQAQ
jgi:hypothetical protein